MLVISTTIGIIYLNGFYIGWLIIRIHIDDDGDFHALSL